MAWTLLLQLTLLLSYTWLISTPASATNVNTSCPDHCGEVPIPYPFGIGSSCSRNRFFNLNCNNSYTPPRPFWGSLETTNITLEGQMFIKSWIAEDCYSESGRSFYANAWVSLLKNGPFSFSNTRNKFVAIGCDTNAFITGYWGQNFSSGCTTYCTSLANVINGTCSGIGCCQTSIPPGIKYFDINIRSYDKHSGILDFNPCSYAFLVDQDNFNFSVSDLFYNSSYSSEYIRVPVVLDWAVSNETCESARRNSTAFACQSENGDCYYPTNSPGYRCRCNEGYEGNPYLKQGCQDIDECYTGTHECGEGAKCSNTVGSYECHCGNGTLVNATQSCLTISATKFKLLEKITIGVGVSVFFIIIAIGWIFWVMKKRQLIKLKEKFFKENGGVLLQEHINSHGVALGTKIFTAEELEKATNNYDDSRIVGRGGYGIVYKGILLDQTVVAIKKSKIADKTQTEQFINEVFILSQTNHRNVVKLLGICLETQVPLLVYEFVTNGTLYHHIHDEAGLSSLSLDDRLRIASETAGALAYLHFSASMPIFHRDVKSANILLDKNMNAKVSDFGASRLVPLDQTQLTTLVQGTLGYLDPEYFHTGQLTEKSDVYSFGVVLVELLTGAKPICPTRTQEEKNLSSYFLSSLKENRLFGILPVRVVDEGNSEQIIAVAELAKRCLKLTGEERPTMKEVETELEGLRRFTKHSSIQNNNEETQILPSESFVEAYSNGGCVIEQDSLPNRSISGLEIGR